MSNMTKTIAILGVVAGLGVAALPLSTYAADPDVVEWKEGGATTAPAEATEKYGTADGKNWVKTSTQIKLNVPDALSIDASTDEVTLTDADSKGQYTEADGVSVQVISRNNSGYTLSMIGSGEGTTKTDLIISGTNYNIATGAIADITTFDQSTGASAWGYRVMEKSEGSAATVTDANAYLAVASDGSVIANETTAADYTYKIGFGAVVAAGQAAGDYVGEVTFIATNNQ